MADEANINRTNIKTRVLPKKIVSNSTPISHKLSKRCHPPHVKQSNAIYITNKSNFQGQLSQCEKLIGEDEDDVTIHGMGAAISKAINLALQLKDKYCGAFELHVETSTVTLVDDLEPLTDEADYESRTRQNSAVCVRLVRNKQCPVNQL